MKTRIAVISVGLVVVAACSNDLSAPVSTKRVSEVRQTRVDDFNAEELSRLDKILAQFPADKAARLKAAFLNHRVLISDDATEQAEINAIYAARAQRIKAAGGSFRRASSSPSSAGENWVPTDQEQVLIDAFLQTFPPEVRGRLLKVLLRTNTKVDVSQHNPAGQEILNKIYASRDARMNEDPFTKQ